MDSKKKARQAARAARAREDMREQARQFMDALETGDGNWHAAARSCGLTLRQAQSLMIWFEADAERQRVLGQDKGAAA